MKFINRWFFLVIKLKMKAHKVCILISIAISVAAILGSLIFAFFAYNNSQVLRRKSNSYKDDVGANADGDGLVSSDEYEIPDTTAYDKFAA